MYSLLCLYPCSSPDFDLGFKGQHVGEMKFFMPYFPIVQRSELKLYGKDNNNKCLQWKTGAVVLTTRSLLSWSSKDLIIKAVLKRALFFRGTHPGLETGRPTVGSGHSHLAPPPLCPFVTESDRWRRTCGHGGPVPGGRTVSGQGGAAPCSNFLLLVLDGRLQRYNQHGETMNTPSVSPWRRLTSECVFSPYRNLLWSSSSTWMCRTQTCLMSTLAACRVKRSDEPRHDRTNLHGSLSTLSSRPR